VGITTPLRQRDFRLLWTGMTVSLLGDGVFIVAVAWQAYALADRPAALASIGVATSLPQVIMLLVGGAVADRFPRRRVLLLADAARAATMALLAALAMSGTLELWQLVVAGALIGTATAFAAPAFDAIVPQLVQRRELTHANAIDQFIRPATLQLAGPALGGAVVALLRPGGALAFDALTFAFSAVCVARMSRLPAPAIGAGRRLRHDLHDGLRYVFRNTWLWGTFVCATLTYVLFIGPTQVLLPYIVRDSLHGGASTYGAILAVGGIGALLGAVAAGRSEEPRRPLPWIYVWWALATLGVAGYGIATRAWGFALAALLVNGAEAVGAVLWSTLKQRRVENAMLGRVSSIDWCVSTALLPVSFAITAPVAEAWGARTTLALGGVLGAAVTLCFLVVPGIRSSEGGESQLVTGSAEPTAPFAPG
jgi:MFS family permease